MNPFGTTRSVVQRDHALVSPDSHVPVSMPEWDNAKIVTLISPRMGARFQQFLVQFDAEGSHAMGEHPTLERFVFVLDGAVSVQTGGGSRQLTPGGYAYLPPNFSHSLHSPEPSRLLVIEQHYTPQNTWSAPEAIFGQEQDVEGKPFLGDPDARLQTLLPEHPRMDMAVNIFTYQLGATLPFVEVHVMEHGLLMLQGAGVYRLSQSWYPVQAGDVLWMAPYCPQWFVAMGKTPARYIYYKDVNRDPLGDS